MQTTKIVLKPLEAGDAGFLYTMYTDPAVAMCYSEPPFSDGEPAADFTMRLINFCEAIFTIRLADSPDIAIGDCALHHWNPAENKIEIGGSLLPAFWGKGLMKEAFGLLAEFAREKFEVTTLIGKTELTNLKAAKLVEKMGFERYKTDDANLFFRKTI